MRRRLLVATGILLALGGTALSAGGAYAYFWDRSQVDLIAPGVRIAGVDVGGLRAAQAQVLLERRLVRLLSRPVLVDAAGERFVVRPSSAGLAVGVTRMIDTAIRSSRDGGLAQRLIRAVRGRRLQVSIPLSAALSPPALERLTVAIARAVRRPPRNARVVPSATTLRIVPSHNGLGLRRRALERELAQTILDLHARRSLVAPMRTLLPRWSTSSLRHRYRTYILVSRETFTLRLYKGLALARTYRIAVGRSGLETPAGLYSIDDRQVDPSWHVPLSSWAGDLAGKVIPPGPQDPIKARWLGFYNGAGIHGTDDVASLGSAASHGCIRMSIADVEELYPLVPLHTPIYVG
jgi:hypothetical protein